ncbi:DUF1462 family protein, partial [Listeria riparia]
APQEEAELKKIADMIVDEDYMYPVIVIDGEVIAEGNPRLKDIYAMMTDRGYQAV